MAEIINGLWDIVRTIIIGFFTTPGLNVLTYTAVVIGAVRVSCKAALKR